MTLAILAIDIGSSSVKWGLHDGKKWLIFDRFGSIERLSQFNFPIDPTSIVVSCVGDISHLNHVDALGARWGIDPIHVVPKAIGYGLINGYQQPETLGPDRWVGMIAARQQFEGPLLVVDAGTAVTIDYIDETGCFLGGSILPGLSIMKRSLIEHTANLTLEVGHWTENPTTTADAMSTGFHVSLGLACTMASQNGRASGGTST